MDKQVAQEGNDRSPEGQSAEGINIIQNTKRPSQEIFWNSRVLNCEASSPIQLKFELHWDFRSVLVASKFEEDLTENEHHFLSLLKGM